MADFVANIQARLDTKNIPNDIKQIETKNSVQLSQFTVNQANLTRAIQNALNSTTFTIRNINIPNLAPQFQNVGQNIGSSISTGLQRSLSIGVDSIEDMTTLLQNMGVQGRNIDAVTEKLNNMNIAVTRINTQMRGTNIDMRVTGIDELGRVVTSVQRLNTAAEEGEEPITHLGTTIQQSFDTGAAAAKQFATDLERAQAALNSNAFNASISGVQASYEKVANTGHASLATVEADINTLINLQNQMRTATDNNDLVARYNEFNEVLVRVQNNLKIANNFKQQFASATEVNAMINKMEAWLSTNTKAAKTYGAQVNSYIQQLRNMNTTGVRSRSTLNSIADGFKNVDMQAGAAGLKTQTFMDKLRTSFGTVSRYISASTVLYAVFRSIRNGVSNVVELDTALVDLKKTTDATESQLKDFYYTSNDIAKQLGVTTKEVISAAAEWSRLGYSIKDAETMAKTSSIFSSISPGLDIEQATDGLVSAMKAFDISANDALDGIASKINSIGNSQAVSNADIVEFLTRSSSAMKEANNSLEETIALGTAATEITRDAASVGQALKTISMRIRGYDEETEQFTGNVEILSGKIADLTKTADNPGGISLFTDETKQTFKSTTQLLRDISEVYDDLTDKQQAELLEKLAGKRQGQIIAAILNNFKAVESSLGTMSNSAGNAEKEMSVIMDSLEYKINRLKETGTGFFQNLFDTQEMGDIIDFLTDVLNFITSITSALGLFGTVLVGLGIVKSIKSIS